MSIVILDLRRHYLTLFQRRWTCTQKNCQLYEICFGMVSLFFKIVLYFWKDSINAIIKLCHPERSRRKFPQWNGGGGMSLTFKRQKGCVARVSKPPERDISSNVVCWNYTNYSPKVPFRGSTERAPAKTKKTPLVIW